MIRSRLSRRGLLQAIAAGAATPAPMQPLALHPENPRYFLYEGRPTVLVTSGEHYGALLNLDFDFVRYLDELHARGFNQTRTFAGTYRELPGSFRIQHNTLAPAPGRYLCPWARSATPGAADGGNRWDLERWDPAYFQRLEALLDHARRRGVIVELVLFCTFYEDRLWEICPMNARNNVQGVGAVARTEPLTLKDARLVALQEALVREIVRRLNRFPNLYYEICNEPYFQGVAPEWQAHIAATIARTEAELPQRHLIAQNIANKTAVVRDPDPHVSIFNFHYAYPPTVVAENAHLRRPIGFDESGFRGCDDRPYRTEAWAFLLAGGAIYSNLDYSFTVDHPDGTAPVTPPTPGGGGPRLRGQLAFLARFMRSLPFWRMRADRSWVRGVPEGVPAHALVEPGRHYALHLDGGGRVNLSVTLPAGRYAVTWYDPLTGEPLATGELASTGEPRDLPSPPYREDVVLRLARCDD